jgi:lupus La protein
MLELSTQVEFYFGDWNYPQDKFMWESCGGTENKPIAIKKIHSFKRMRNFQPYSAVVAALRDSEVLEVEGEEGEELVKRKVAYKPMPSAKAKAEAATVYVKGFGDETPNTQFDLESFFATFGEVKGLKLRRTNEDFFKGSVFVTFADEETAKKLIEADPVPKWKDHELKIMSKHDYCEEKNEMIRQGKLEPNSNNPKKFYEGKSGRDSHRRGGQDPDDWKNRRERDQRNGFRGDRRGGGRGRGGRGGRGGGRGGRDRDGDRRSRRDGENGERRKDE